MHADITALDVSGRRRSLAAYAAGMALYCLVVVALYPAFEHSTSLDALVKNDPTAAALFGATGSISSSDGWLNANIYANFFPLVMLLLTIGYGAAALAGQDEEGTLCLIATLPVRRSVIVWQKLGAMAVQAAVLAAAVGVFVLAGRSFDLTVKVGDVVAVSGAVFLMGLDFGLLTMAVGAATGSRGTALGVGAAVAAMSYLVSSLAPVVGWVHPARYVSVFYWAVGNDQIGAGVSLLDIAALTGAGVLALVATLAAFERADLR
jgi:ABC-2 type transport system permease protein